MAKPGRKPLPVPTERVAEMLARGLGPLEISKALDQSLTTVNRWCKAVRGQANELRAKNRAQLPSVPEGAPIDAFEGTPLATVNYWLAVAQREAKAAEVAGEAEHLVKMVRLAASLLDAQRKASPPPVRDPNCDPDLVEAADLAIAKLLALVDSAA